MHFLLDDRAGLPAAHMLERRDGRTDMYHIGGGNCDCYSASFFLSFFCFNCGQLRLLYTLLYIILEFTHTKRSKKKKVKSKK